MPRRRSLEPAAVVVRGPATDVLHKRRDDRIEVDGGKDLLDYHLERVSFG